MLPQIPVIRIADAQKLPLPTYADGVGTCMILRSAESKSIKIAPQRYEIFTTGFAMALPIGMEAQIRSLKESTLNGITVLNAPLTLDASDRAEIKICIYNASQESVIIKPNDPIALMVFALALRVQWNDQTPSIVEKIHKKQVENEQQIEADTERRKVAEEMVANMLVQDTPVSENKKLTDIEELKEESIFNEIMTEPLNETQEKDIQSVAEDISLSEGIDEKHQLEEGMEPPAILTQIAEEISQNDFQIERNVNYEEENDVLSNISIDSPLLDEPVAPPAILEEFEKIENSFDVYQTEDKV